MKRYSFVTALLAALAAGSGAANAQLDNDPAYPRLAASLCRALEIALFTCDIRSKKVSICGDEAHGRAVYRFGRLGRIEMEATDLHHAVDGRSEEQVYAETRTGRYIVYFKLDRAGFDADGNNDPTEITGLDVQRGEQTIQSRPCAQPATFAPLTAKLVPSGTYMPH